LLVVSSTSFFFSSRRRHTRCYRDWSSDVCSSDLRQNLQIASTWLLLGVAAFCRGRSRRFLFGRERARKLWHQGLTVGLDLEDRSSCCWVRRGAFGADHSRRTSVSDPEQTIDRKIFDQVRSPLAGCA